MKIKKYYTSYAQAPFELWDDEELTIAQKGILNFIWSITAHRDGNKAIILSKVLEKITGLTRMNVYNNIKRLEELGYISKALVKTEYSTNKVTEYTLNLPYLISKYEKKGMRVELSTDEENEKNVKKVEKTLDKTTQKPYTYMSAEEKKKKEEKEREERRAYSIRLAEERNKNLKNYPYRKREN